MEARIGDMNAGIFADEVLKLFGVKDSNFNMIVDPHYDSNGRIDGGLVITNGKVSGRADPSAEPGTEGPKGG